MLLYVSMCVDQCMWECVCLCICEQPRGKGTPGYRDLVF